MFNELKKFPVVLIFFAFLFSFSVLDELWPKRERSELENRQLTQYSAITLKSVFEEDYKKTWMANFDKYIKDQFILRDEWIDLKSRCEGALLKLENNGVWFGKDDTMFQKLLTVSDKQYEANMSFLASFATKHGDKLTAMIVPSASLVWEDKLPFAAPIIDEDKYLDKLNNSITTAGANVIDLRSAFEQNKDAELYYKTDHHWTTDGAYIAYKELASAQGLELFDRNAFDEKTVKGFLGTNYSKARKYGSKPENIKWYDLPNEITIYKTDGNSDGTTLPLYDEAKWETRDKYSAFLRGNNGYSIINGNPNGKNILVIKDSYANCFVPFLTENYNKIGIVDLRSTVMNVDDLIANENYDEILVLYNFQTFTNDTYLWKLEKK